MNIAFLAVRADHASVRYRTIQYIPRLAEHGIEASLIVIPKGFYSRLTLFRSLAGYDLVVLQRKLFNLVNFLPLRAFAKQLIYDLDDALFLKDSKADRSFSLTRRMRLKRTARAADFVICGNGWVLENIKPLNKNSTVIPTVVDLDRYPRVKTHEDGPAFTAVWVGGRSTLFYLERILPALESLANKIKGFRLMVISDRFPESVNLAMDKIPWSLEGEVRALMKCDVGLMPLVNDEWSRGKCGLKLLQYGAAGLPSVCSPVGVNPEIVKHGASGFHAREAGEWINALLRLSLDPGLRARMGNEARKTVAEQYSVQAWEGRYIDLLRRVAQGIPSV
jgi:glycosyltransferase involved in cell wall biosynthesis